MAGRPVRISIIANGRQARAELQQTGAAMDRLNRTVGRAGKAIGAAFAVGAIIRAGKAVLANGDAYTSQLNRIEALTTAQQRAQVGGISGVAKQLEAAKGAYAKYGNTVADAASGVTELVKAGQSLPQALKSVNATLVLAKAGEMDVASASSLVATALTTWHLPAKRAGDIANYLANAANISTADVSDLGEALKFVAPVAAKAGISAKQTAAYLAQLSNAGINGTLAGTGLRKVMESLQAPSGAAAKTIKALGLEVFDAQGKARPFGAVLAELNGKLNTLTDKQRKGDLRNLFGLTGVVPAQVLLQGTKAIDEYTKGVGRAGAAQKLAEANSKGLMGTLRRFQALAQSVGQQAYRAFSPLVDKALRPMVDAFEKNQGALSAQARALGGNLVPLMGALGDAAQGTAEGIKGAAHDMKPFVPLLGKLVDVATVGAKAFAAIPGPIKTLAIEAGLASLVLPRLAAGFAVVSGRVKGTVAGVGALRAEMRLMSADRAWQQGLNNLSAAGIISTRNLNTTTRTATNLRATLAKVGPAAGAAAGIGGMLALTQSANESNKALAGVERVGGAALLGFAVGGPVGAAIGGTIGLLGTLKGAFHQSADAAAEAARVAGAKDSWASAQKSVSDLTAALHGTIKAYNDVTAAAVQKGFRNADGQIKPWVQSLLDAGVSMDTLTRAALGQSDAMAVLNGAQGQVSTNLAARKGQWDQAKLAASGYESQLRTLNQTIAQQGHGATAGQIAEQERLNGLLRGARTDVGNAANAYKDYASSVAEGKRELTAFSGAVTGHRASMSALARDLGVTLTAYKKFPSEVRTQFEAGNVPQTKTQIADLARTYKLTPRQVLSVFKAAGIAVSKSDARTLGIAYNKVPKELKATAKVVGGAAAAGAAGRFGSSAGSAYGSGFVGGIHAWTGRAEFAAAAMAAAAHAAAMRNLDAHSPSRKMIKVGKWFSQGFAIGIRKDASKVLDAVDALYGKLDKKQTRGVKKIVKNYTDGAHGLRAIAKAQSAVNDKLADARQKLAETKQAWVDYANTVKSNVVSFADVTEVGKNSAGNASASGVIAGLKQRAAAVAQYVTTVRSLIAKHLNATSLQQILDKGVDGGLQAALAINAGGSGTVAQINAIQAQINAQAASLGNAASHRMNDAGVQAAQGLVNGLVSQQKSLEQAATKLANALVKAVKKKLGIKSPSTVFRQIGVHNVEGLRIGMDGTYVHRTGELAAASLVKGFGSPDLSAYMSSVGANAVSSGSAQRVHLTAEQVDALRRGRDVIADSSVAASNGARTLR